MSEAQPSRAAAIRSRNRADLMAEIVRIGRQHLIRDGVAGLSLRAVTRDLGMASSAVYRYVASREDLLALLVADAHEDLAAAVEKAVANGEPGDVRARWTALCLAIRRWAIGHRQQYALLYGPNAVGPNGAALTVVPPAGEPAEGSDDRPGTRPHGGLRDLRSATARADDRLLAIFAGILAAASARGAAAPRTDPPVGPALSVEISALVASSAFADAAGQVKKRYVTRGLVTWVTLFGLVSAEVFGTGTPGVSDHEAFFTHAVQLLADTLELPGPPVAKAAKSTDKPRNAWTVRPKRHGA